MIASKLRKYLLPALISAFVVCGAKADVVVLKNGRRVEGRIVAETPNIVRIRDYSMEYTIPRSQIEEIQKAGGGELSLQMAEEAIEKGNLEKAERYLAEAEEAGVKEEKIAAANEKIRAIRVEAEMAQYKGLINALRTTRDIEEQGQMLNRLIERVDDLSEDSPVRDELVDVVSDVALKRANHFLDIVEYRKAIEELKTVIRLNPTLPQPFLDLGNLYQKTSGLERTAIANYEKALELNTGELSRQDVLHIHFSLGELYRSLSDWNRAAAHYRAVYAEAPRYDLRLEDRLVESFLHGATMLRQSDKEEALGVVEKALAIRRAPDLVKLKAKLLHELNRYEQSNEAIQEYIHLVPRARGMHEMMSENHFAMGELLAGREALLREVEVDPNNIEVYLKLGNLALQRDDYEDATKYYEQVLTVDPDESRAFLGLGKTYRRAEDLGKARQMVERVLNKFPANREANLEMGRILRDENQLEEALDYFTRVLELIDEAPEEEQENLKQLKADALIARGEIQLITTGPGTANNDFHRALEIVPNYASAYYNIGLAYKRKFASSKQLSDLKKAEENIQRAKELESINPEYPLALGILYHQNLAQADPANKRQYHQSAVKNYRRYIELGGADRSTVSAWMKEIGG